LSIGRPVETIPARLVPLNGAQLARAVLHTGPGLVHRRHIACFVGDITLPMLLAELPGLNKLNIIKIIF
jgi:hypothetical protein